MKQKSHDTKIDEALAALQVVLRNHYGDDTIVVECSHSDCDAYIKNERFTMGDAFASEKLEEAVEECLKKFGFYLEWTNEVCFWLYEV